MRKILFVINTLGHAGAETALMELLRHIDLGKYQVDLFVLLGQGEMVRELPEGVRLLNRKYDDCSVLSAKGKLHLARHVAAALLSRGTVFRQMPYLCAQLAGMARRGRIQPDKLLWRPMAAGAQRVGGKYDLAVAYLEGGAAYYVADYVEAARKAAFIHVDYVRAGYGRSLDGGCYRKMDRIFPVSDEVRESFLSVYPECEDRTEVFHNLLDKGRILRKAALPGGFEDGYEGFRILTVGRLTPQKDFRVSVEAMRLLKDGGVRARWYVLGEGEERGALERKIRELRLEDDFFLLGAVENPYPYMAQADLYVHATQFEGKSIAIQEAQVLGRAIVASDCSGNREQVEPGVDGILCEMTPEGICEGVRELLADGEKRRRLGCAAAARAVPGAEEVEKLLRLVG